MPDTLSGIDVHCHLYPSTYVEFVRRAGRHLKATLERAPSGHERLVVPGMPAYELTPRLCSPDDLVAWMDEVDLAQVVLTPAPPTTQLWVDPAVTRELIPAVNEGIAAAVRAYPQRIIGGAAVALNAPEQAPDQVTEAARRWGLRAALALTSVNGKNLDEPEFMPFFQCAAELGLPVFVHPNPFNPLGHERLTRHYLHHLVGMTTDTAAAAGSLIFGGVLERLPALRLWFAHSGGSFLVLYPRMEQAYGVRADLQGAVPRPPSAYLPQLYFDTLCHDAPTLQFAVQTWGAGRLMIGSDRPFPVGALRPMDLIRPLTLTDRERAQIACANARDLFRLPVASPVSMPGV